jgi:hypothetical protein
MGLKAQEPNNYKSACDANIDDVAKPWIIADNRVKTRNFLRLYLSKNHYLGIKMKILYKSLNLFEKTIGY